MKGKRLTGKQFFYWLGGSHNRRGFTFNQHHKHMLTLPGWARLAYSHGYSDVGYERQHHRIKHD
jgi:hypothetical protein